MSYLIIFMVTYLLVESNGAVAPFITPCHSDDVECLTSSTSNAMPYLAAGIPSLKVPSADPLHFKEINADQGDLKLTFKDMNVVGIAKCKLREIKRDIAESTITLEVECPIKATGTYILDGKLLFIPAQGNGDFEIKTNKAIINVVLKYKTIAGNGDAKHWKITAYDFSYDLVERVSIELDNLFGGDQTRAKPILDILNNSWKELITEIGSPIIKEVVGKAVDIVKKFMLNVPINELEL